MGLDLYAKVEELFHFEAVTDFLWQRYIDELLSLDVKRVLDIGCGGGKFCAMAKEQGLEVVGIDLSEKMVEAAQKRGCEATHVDVCEFEGEFDAAVAIFDVINYMDKSYVKTFFSCVEKRLKKGGFFLFDINSYFGFSEIAEGTISAENETIFAVLTSHFEKNRLKTEITCFDNSNGEYTREDDEIIQYYYTIQSLEKITSLRLQREIPIKLYSDEVDKHLIIMRKDNDVTDD